MMRRSSAVMFALGIALAILGLLEMDADVSIMSSVQSWWDSLSESSDWASIFHLGSGENICAQRERDIWEYLIGSERPKEKGYFLSAVCFVYDFFGGSSPKVESGLLEDIWSRFYSYVSESILPLLQMNSLMRETRNMLTLHFMDMVKIGICSWIVILLTYKLMSALLRKSPSPSQPHQENSNSPLTSIAANFESFKLIVANASYNFFRAKSKKTQRDVFVKCLRKGCSKSTRKRLEKEYGVLKNINLPNIIKVVDWYQLGDTYSIGLEFSPFGNLKEAMCSEDTKIRDRLKFVMFQQIASAAHFLHNSGMAHLNIRPGNVLVFDKWSLVKLSGFDRAMKVQSGSLCRLYNLHSLSIAPEVAKHRPYDPYKADVWALGALFFNIITGDYLQKDTGLPLDRRVLPSLSSCDINRKRGVMEILNCALFPIPTRRPDSTQLMRRFKFFGL